MTDFRIEGTCDPRFQLVKEAFAENFEKRNEYGGAVAVTNDPANYRPARCSIRCTPRYEYLSLISGESLP